MHRVLSEEAHPVEKLELTSAALSIKANIEMFRQEQKNYDDWAKAAELRKGVRLAILDKCNVQVKKVLFAEYPID